MDWPFGLGKGMAEKGRKDLKSARQKREDAIERMSRGESVKPEKKKKPKKDVGGPEWHGAGKH